MLGLILATRVTLRNIIIAWFIIAAVVGFPIIWINKAAGVDKDKAYRVGGLVGCGAATLLFLIAGVGLLAE